MLTAPTPPAGRPRSARPRATAARLARGIALLAAATAAAGAAAVPAAADTAPAADQAGAGGGAPAALLAPTGPRTVGTTTLHLTDESRADIWHPDAAVRELMVTVWYPAARPTGHRADYMTPAESAATVESLGLDFPDDTFSEIRTHSFTDAPVRATRGGWPMVLLSPGAGNSRTTLTTLAEDLASHGYVAVGVDHAYEAGPVEFPGGRVLGCDACAQDRWPEGTRNRAADVSFVIDELTGPDAVWPGGRRVDTDRIGMAGHSAGGSAAAEVLRTDDRVGAGLNFDGPYYAPALEEGVEGPLGLIAGEPQPFGDSQEAMWPRQTGWRQWLVLTGSAHSSATDRGVLVDRLGLRDQIPAEDIANQYGTGDPEHLLRIVREYTTAFFTQHLRGSDQPVVRDPSGVHPELVVIGDEQG